MGYKDLIKITIANFIRYVKIEGTAGYSAFYFIELTEQDRGCQNERFGQRQKRKGKLQGEGKLERENGIRIFPGIIILGWQRRDEKAYQDLRFRAEEEAVRKEGIRGGRKGPDDSGSPRRDPCLLRRGRSLPGTFLSRGKEGEHGGGDDGL
ncbi:hypothetical protein HMPREF1986_02756 [Oribacterium sp. oral taxon 078 str. F0263]|nr:hypothetical protein HMPREF1986_02756 [Oribacterium sp. oral taxon 078 str. F0263]